MYSEKTLYISSVVETKSNTISQGQFLLPEACYLGHNTVVLQEKQLIEYYKY